MGAIHAKRYPNFDPWERDHPNQGGTTAPSSGHTPTDQNRVSVYLWWHFIWIWQIFIFNLTYLAVLLTEESENQAENFRSLTGSELISTLIQLE